LGGAKLSELDTFQQSFESEFPLWQNARCVTETIDVGQVVYYPPGWWHQTTNLDPETIVLTGRVITPKNHIHVMDSFREHCGIPPRQGCYDPRHIHGLRTPPRLIDMPVAGASVCMLVNAAAQMVGSAVNKMLQFAQISEYAPRPRAARHGTPIDVHYYSLMCVQARPRFRLPQQWASDLCARRWGGIESKIRPSCEDDGHTFLCDPLAPPAFHRSLAFASALAKCVTNVMAD
jgi:hypothetical protein